MLITRLRIGFLLVATLVLLLWLDEALGLSPWFPFWFLTSVVVLGMASLEIVSLLKATSARPSGNTVFAGIMALTIANWAPHLSRHLARAYSLEETMPPNLSAAVDAFAWPLWAFAGIVMVAFIAQGVQFQKPGATMATIAGTVLAVAYIGLLGSFIVQIRWLDPRPYYSVIPLAALVATSKGADTGAYTLGRIAGRHKLWPKLSPNKTVEGAVGGLIGGVVAALLVVAVGRYLFAAPTLSWGTAVGFGVLVGTAAQLGDLMESMIKRDCAQKDASATLPGFGGVLDVLDSLLFAGPVAFGFWLCFGP